MNRTSSILQSSRREALFVMLLWLASCVYTVGYAALFAYRQEAVPRMILGMPGWVFWGVLLPWMACSLVTCWYALDGMRDEDLGEEVPSSEFVVPSSESGKQDSPNPELGTPGALWAAELGTSNQELERSDE
jgi:uncharacterized protein DUF997